jgi:myosin-5
LFTKKIFDYIGAVAFNNLIIRKELCNWIKAIDIHFNMQGLDQFIAENQLIGSNSSLSLVRLAQACELLQNLDSSQCGNAARINKLTSELTIAQIKHICVMYTPLEQFPTEKQLKPAFVSSLVNYCKALRRDADPINEGGVIHEMAKKSYDVRFPFAYSNVSLESIQLSERYASFLTKV